MKKEKLTIRDIAKMAKVSPMTVSRVLNGDSRVKEETKKKILQLVNKVKYRPNARARAFVKKKSNLIGIVVSDISNPFYAELAKGIEDKAQEKGYNVIFSSVTNKSEKTETYVHLLMDSGVDGLIFGSVRLHEPVVEELISKGFPLVLVNRKIHGEACNYVVLNNEKGAYDIVEHLINLGYRKIGIIIGGQNLSTGLERLKGYKRALKDHRIQLNENYIIQSRFTKVAGYEGAKRFLAMKDRPEAIFGGNDYIAMGVIDAVEESGLHVPEDIALVGFDDTEFAANSRINLTTISQRTYEMGNLGAQILIDYIERKETDYIHKIILEPRIIIRGSCGEKLREKLKDERVS